MKDSVKYLSKDELKEYHAQRKVLKSNETKKTIQKVRLKNKNNVHNTKIVYKSYKPEKRELPNLPVVAHRDKLHESSIREHGPCIDGYRVVYFEPNAEHLTSKYFEMIIKDEHEFIEDFNKSVPVDAVSILKQLRILLHPDKNNSKDIIKYTRLFQIVDNLYKSYSE